MSDSPVSETSWFSYVKDNFEKNLSGKKLRALQIGVYKGDATEWLINHCEIEFLLDVDMWGLLPNYFGVDMNLIEEEYDKKFKDCKNLVKFKSKSADFFAQFHGEGFDFIYIDGDHSAIQTALDAISAWKILKPGGVLAFDDYDLPGDTESLFHPRRGINCFMTLFENELEILEQNYQLWIRKNQI